MLHAVSQVQCERKYANYMLLMCVCFLLAPYQHLANTAATKKANTKLHKLLVHLHTNLCYRNDASALFFQAVLLSRCICSPVSSALRLLVMAIMNIKTLHLIKGISGLMRADLLLYL